MPWDWHLFCFFVTPEILYWAQGFTFIGVSEILLVKMNEKCLVNKLWKSLISEITSFPQLPY